MTKRRVLLACDLDSQVFGALPLALAFSARDWEVTFAIESVRTLPQLVLERLTRDFNLIERPISALPIDDEIFRHDAVGVFVTGSRLAMFRHLLKASSRVKGKPRPALFCGFNGLVFEKFEEGLAWRLGYDVIGLNGPRDRDAFVDFLHATEYSRQPSVIVGLRRKTDTPPRPMKHGGPEPAAAPDKAPAAAPAKRGKSQASEAAQPSRATDGARATSADPRDVAEAPDGAVPESSGAGPAGGSRSAAKTGGDAPTAPAAVRPVPTAKSPVAKGPAPRKLFVFAEQVVVPRSLRERQNLVAILARLADASPNWDVVIKARVKPDEQTFHQQPNHISKLTSEVRRKPANLIVSYEPLDELLDRADLFATVSSTALFDAFDYGVPSMVSTDFGLRNADGAHVFFASGLLVQLSTLASLDAAPIRSPDDRWMRRMGYGAPFSPGALIDWLETFDPSRPMPKSFVSFHAAANVAAGSAAAARICEIWNEIDRWTPDETAGANDPSAPRALLFQLGSLIAEALSPNSRNQPKDAPRDARKEPPPPATHKTATVAPTPASTPDSAPSAPAAPAAAPKTPSPKPPASKPPAPPPPPAEPEPPASKHPASPPPSPKPPAVLKQEGPVASFSRKLGMYWVYKRVRARLGVPVK